MEYAGCSTHEFEFESLPRDFLGDERQLGRRVVLQLQPRRETPRQALGERNACCFQTASFRHNDKRFCNTTRKGNTAMAAP